MAAPLPTMIELRDYATGFCAIRRPSSELGAYDNLVSRCFGAFNRDAERYSLHFHSRQLTQCEGEELLREDKWDNEAYENGGGMVFYAHFVERVRSRSDARGGYRARESTTPPVISSPESSTWTQPPLPNVYGQRLLPPVLPPVHPVPDASGPAPTPVPGSAQPSPAVRRPTTQRRNTNSTTVYSLCTPMPSTHYTTQTYFSGPWFFIRLAPGAPRLGTHAQRYNTPFPGFRPQSLALTTGETAAATNSTPARTRTRTSAPAAVSNPSLASQQQPDDRYPDRQPVTKRGRPRADEQTARPPLPSRDEFDFDLESDDGSTARRPATTRRYARADAQPVLPPPSGDEFDFPLDFDDPPVVRQQPQQEQQEEQEEQQEEQEQEEQEQEEEGRASVARSEDSFGLFVTDESERDFEDELAWENDDEEVEVVEEDLEEGSDDIEGGD